MGRVFAVVGLLLFSSMALAQSEAVVDPDDTCGAQGFQGLIGQSGEIAQLIELDRPMRVIGPDTMVTMDYRVDRLNFHLGDDSQIIRIECG